MDTSNWPRWAWWVIIAVSITALVLLSCEPPPPITSTDAVVTEEIWPTDVWPPDTVRPTPIQSTAMPDVFLTTLEIDGIECPCICRKVKDAK